MKKYPRISSLSTLGLRHHQAFDYRFHPFRTDFVGDSGCGKSMIADLLQLILVGQDAFSSPTQSTGPRDPSGMVLPHSGGGSGIGYAFLNLEVAHKQYVVIGIYLEDSSNTVKHFIIQAGYGEERLYPFSVPLSIADVIKSDRIPLPDELDTIMQDLGLVRTTPARKTFHHWLHTHELLPLDLSASDKILRDYASIIRAFSRGKLLTITEPESLKAFLFGQEKAKEMWGKFGKAVQDMRESAQQDEWNAQAITDLEAKGAAIDALSILKNDYENARKAWLTASFNDVHRQTSEALEGLQTVTRGAKDGLIALEAYRKIIRQKLAGSEEAVAHLATAYDASYERLRPAEARYTDLQEAQAIVAKTGCGAADLAKAYHRSKTLQNIEQFSAEMSQALQAINAVTLFETLLTPASTFSTIINDMAGSLAQKNAALQDNLHLLRFADINAEGSLGQWAIAQEKALSREVESILMHYIDLPTRKEPTPVKGTRAITSPDRLFANPTIIMDGKVDGFWIQLNGLEELIAYVPEQIFTEGGLTEIAQRLETLSASARASADALQAEIATMEQLRVCLQQLSRPQESIEAYQAQSQLVNEHSNPHLDFPEERLELCLQSLQSETSIEAEHSRLKEAMEAAQAQKIMFSKFVGEMLDMESKLCGHLEQNRWTDNLRQIEEAVLPTGYYNDAAAIERQTIAEEAHEENVSRFYRDKIDNAVACTNTHEVTRKWNEYGALKEAFAAARMAYITAYVEEPHGTTEPIGDLKFLQESFNSADGAYQVKFSMMVQHYCPSEAYKFERTKSYTELCTAILPDILGRARPEGESEREAINRQLRVIAEKAKELNGRKLARLRELLDEVHEEANNRINDARLIDLFLNSDAHKITGGHKARLERELSRQYPIQWLRSFADRLNPEGELFFSEGQSVADLTSDTNTLDEKLLQAFLKLGGKASSGLTVQKLLDPNSYFNVSFSMRSGAGKANMGSAGQTYTAIAMLCIARLSLVGAQGAADKSRGLRFMPIDEAEGLGTNYDLLHQIAADYDYQIISMSINPLSGFRKGEQYIYSLRKNFETDEEINYTPWAIYDDAEGE